ncbi:uncharacterized protein LOC143194950 isoform X2 [Rhynchophorus ferrugineus]|uniref:Spaetzle domain-containing protein n=1 Tax=Rhynchophorus ferrugineus TaxID=354439 RepID=A0A834HZG8_RHYFE|nr:hypothetical protein GWI33_015608 [Rhynchophorus ferrugineus]
MYNLCVFLLIAFHAININHSADIPQISFEVSENDTLYWEPVPDYIQKKITESLGSLGSVKPTVIETKRTETKSCEFCLVESGYTEFPTMIKNRKGYSLYLVNTEKYESYIRIVKCSTKQDDSTCLSNKLLNTYPYETKCVQRTSDIKLLVYNIDTNKIQEHSISYPSACECLVKDQSFE